MRRNETSPQRGWGPFTGRQLAAVICTIAVVALLPVGASAVSGSNVFVTDSGTGTRAKVDSVGNLRTQARVATPANLYFAHGNSGSSCREYAPPAGKSLVVTSVHVTIKSGTLPTSVELYAGTTGTCPSTFQDSVYFTAYGTQTFTFGSGLPIANGHSLGVKAVDDNPVASALNGYLTAASDCTSTCK